MKRGQSAVEFAVLVSFMFFIFIVFFVAVGDKLVDIQKQSDRDALEELGDYLQQEIAMASSAFNGYDREFNIPRTLSGREYEVVINEFTPGAINHTELVIKYKQTQGDYVVPLSVNVTGYIDLSISNNVTIEKKGDVVYVKT